MQHVNTSRPSTPPNTTRTSSDCGWCNRTSPVAKAPWTRSRAAATAGTRPSGEINGGGDGSADRSYPGGTSADSSIGIGGNGDGDGEGRGGGGLGGGGGAGLGGRGGGGGLGLGDIMSTGGGGGAGGGGISDGDGDGDGNAIVQTLQLCRQLSCMNAMFLLHSPRRAHAAHCGEPSAQGISGAFIEAHTGHALHLHRGQLQHMQHTRQSIAYMVGQPERAFRYLAAYLAL